MTVRKAKNSILTNEFIKWKEKFEREYNEEFHREDHHCASVCWEIYKIQVMLGSKQKFEYKDFLPKFTLENRPIPTAPQQQPLPQPIVADIPFEDIEPSEQEKERRRKLGMSWKPMVLSAFGFDPESGQQTRQVRAGQKIPQRRE